MGETTYESVGVSARGKRDGEKRASGSPFIRATANARQTGSVLPSPHAPTPPPTVCLHPRAQHPDSNPALDQSECLFTAIVTMEPTEGARRVAMETASVYNVWKEKKRETRPYERATPFVLLSAPLLHFNGFPRWEAEVTISAAGGLLHWVISLLLSY